MEQQDAADTVDEIYGFELCYEAILTITNRMIELTEKRNKKISH